MRLNAAHESLVHNVCFPSDIAPDCAPEGRTLVSVSVHGEHGLEENQLLTRVRGELAGWFGAAALEWKHLRTYSIPHALPGAVLQAERVSAKDGVYICGDHTAYPSLNAALGSGRLVAEAILAGT